LIIIERSQNPNLELLEAVAQELLPLNQEVVFLGGAATGLLLTDTAAPPIRITRDIDIIIEVVSLAAYHQFNKKLRHLGFSEDFSPDAPLCRWLKNDMILDVMPTDPAILGFGNRWFAKAFASARYHRLPSGKEIKLLPAPFLLATKIEAFQHRGNNDFVLSTDMEDMVTVIDGRPEIVTEVNESEIDLKKYIKDYFAYLLSLQGFYESLPGFLPPDKASQARATQVLNRMEEIAGQKNS
jgi:predicted nucleotidyltransferase